MSLNNCFGCTRNDCDGCPNIEKEKNNRPGSCEECQHKYHCKTHGKINNSYGGWECSDLLRRFGNA